MDEQKPKHTPLLLSLRDPALLDPNTSPLLKSETELSGFTPVDFWQSMAFGRSSTLETYHEDPIFKLIEANFNRFCKHIANKHPLNLSMPPQQTNIPPIIHFIWMGSTLPSEFNSVIVSWQRCHPGWEIKIWSEKDLQNFRWTNGYSKWAFETAKSLAEKSDIWRYEILYQFGGVYSDVDVICYKSFNDLIGGPIAFFAGQETNSTEDGPGLLYLGNSVFGVSKEHSLIKMCLDHLLLQDEAPNKTIMYRTGSGLLSRSCKEALQTPYSDSILVLPCSYLYPLPHFENLMHKAFTAQEIRTHYVSAESLAVHLWAATWYV